MSLMFPRRMLIASLVPLLAVSLTFGQSRPVGGRGAGQAQVKLVDEVMRDFAKWDVNKNGVLEEGEIDAIVLSTRTKGDESAAAAALHNYIFQEQNAGRPIKIDKKWVTSSPAMAVMGQRIRDTNVDNVTPPGATGGVNAPATQPAAGGMGQIIDAAKTVVPATRPAMRPTTRPIVSPQAFFDGARRAIARAERHLYSGDGPAFDKIRQGGLGDCYLISVLGANTYFHPERMEQMISETSNETFVVKWGDGTTTEVSDLSDGEIASGGAQTAGGLWVRIMEKALAWRELPEEKQENTVAGSKIGKGGNTKMITMLVTGHHAEAVQLFEGKTPLPKDVEAKLKTVRSGLIPALAEKRLVTLGTLPTPVPPPGMNPKHAYAVLKYDEKSDLITIWNPHANTFVAKAPEGLTNGYNTRGGIFTMPLAECARAFGSIAWETNEALKPGELDRLKQTKPGMPPPGKK